MPLLLVAGGELVVVVAVVHGERCSTGYARRFGGLPVLTGGPAVTIKQRS
jgi:hypothetical protein